MNPVQKILLWLAALLLVMLAAHVAWGHDEWQWIQDGGFKSAGGTPCCGSDCRKVYPEGVAWGEETVLVTLQGPDNDGLQQIEMPKASVHVSKDLDNWLCGGISRPLKGAATWMPRCLFIATTAGLSRPSP